MVDVGQKLRKAYFQLLNGELIVDEGVIPIVDEKLDVDINEHDTYVLLTSQDETDASNKKCFVNETIIELLIINQRRATSTKEVVESVSDQILTKLFPERTTCSLVLDNPLSLTYAKYINGNYNPLESNDNGFVISKVLKIKNRITQN